ncbi:MAG: hypothetical protein ACRCXD_14585 [Luteolibacter sp.]
MQWSQLPTPAQTVFVGKDASSDFQSISQAVASIMDASASKPYAVQVAPGLYTEPVTTMKPFVRVIGSGPGITRVRPQAINQRLFTLAPQSEVHGLSCVEKTGSEPVFAYANSQEVGLARLSYIQFGQAEKLLEIRDGSFDSVIQADHLFSSSATNFATAFDVASASGNIASLTLRDSIFIDVSAPMAGTFVQASGIKANVDLHDVTASMVASLGFGLDVSNGATVTGSGVTLEGFQRGVWLRTGSTPNRLSLSSSVVRLSGLLDLDIAQSQALGYFQGEAQRLKIFSQAPGFAFSYVDPSSSGLVVARKFLLGLEHGSATDIAPLLLRSSPVGFLEGGQIASVSGLVVSVAAGSGYAMASGVLSFVSWNAANLTLASDGSNSILSNNSGVVFSSQNESLSPFENIVLGRVVTESGSVRFIQPIGRRLENLASRIEDVSRKYLGSVFRQGSNTSPGATPGTLDVSAGSYAYGTAEFEPSGGAGIIFSAWYRDGSGGYWTVDAITQVPNNQFDNNSGTLASVPANQFVKHLLFVVNDGAQERYLLVFGQTTFTTQVLAEAGALPSTPDVFKGNVASIAAIIMRQGVTTPVAIFDERPTLVSRAGTVSSTSVHANLTGLSADDHSQYLNRSGVRPMTGDLAMGGNAITGVGLVDGVDVSDHDARHAPGGADEIPTAAPTTAISAATSNQTGTGVSLARNDHQHAVVTGVVPSTITPDATAAEGVSAGLARGDHVHAIAAAAPTGSLTPATANAEGVSSSFSRADHTHAITEALVGDITDVLPGVASSAGVADTFARGDHAHELPTAAAVGLTGGSTNTEGTASTTARSDHTHAIANGGTPTGITPDATAAQGTSTSLARSDHVHAAPCDAPVTSLSPAVGNAEGSAGTLARSDHTHSIATSVTGDLVTIIPGAAASQGVSNSYSRGDHRHALPTSAAVGLTGGSTNTEGAAATAARSDHTHAISNGGTPSTITPDAAAAQGTSTSLARSDHAHAIATGAPVAVGGTNAEGTGSDFARADHVHAHGSQTDGTHHAVATQTVAGFLSAADKTKLDSLTSSLTGEVSTTDATVTTVASIPTDTDRTYMVEVWLSGRRTGGIAGAANDTANFIRRFVLKNNAGTLAAPLNLTTEYTQRDQAAWNIALTVSGTNLLVRANGALNNNVDWRAEVRTLRR